jgi:hypothetical protein
MKILLYNPDNGVTRNFMPHLWMFLLKALTPPEHEVLLIDGNAQALDEEGFARRNLLAITSFIFGLDNDTPGVSRRTLDQLRQWPAGLPVFGQLTPFPSTPLYARLEAAGRLTRPKHWMDFAPYQMAHAPLKMTSAQAQAEVRQAWTDSYSPEAISRAVDSLSQSPVWLRISLLLGRLSFRGIYFPQMGRWAWLKVAAQNRRAIIKLVGAAIRLWLESWRGLASVPSSVEEDR